MLYAWKHPGEASALILSGVPEWPIPSRVFGAASSRIGQSSRGWLGPRSQSYLPPRRDTLPTHLQQLWQSVQDAQHKFEQEVDAWHAARLDSMLAGRLDLPTMDSATAARNGSAPHRLIGLRMGEQCFVVANLLRRSFQHEPTVAQLATIGAPTLLIRGTGRNPISDGADTLLRVLPNAQLISLAGTGHDPWLDWPAAFFAHVSRFLRTALADPVLRPESQMP